MQLKDPDILRGRKLRFEL